MLTQDVAEFAAALPDGGTNGGVLLGLDVGTKTVGTALCDARWSFASPAPLIRRTKFSKDVIALAEVRDSRATVGLVIGLPLNLDGSESPRTQSTRVFARNMMVWGLPILLWDERWSTMAVEREMIAADMSRGKRAERIDSAAAAYILQGALDALTQG